MRLPSFVFLICFITVNSANAKDFGVQGHCFAIAEENILELIAKKLKNIDLKVLNEKLKQQTIDYIENPKPITGIIPAKENKIFYFDPSYIVQEDIYDHKNTLIHKKGTKINPLDHVALSKPLIFIDGDDKKQVDLALSYKNAKIILVKGSPLKLQRIHKRWIYFDQAGFLTQKLGITHVPTKISQEDLRLRLEEIVLR